MTDEAATTPDFRLPDTTMGDVLTWPERTLFARPSTIYYSFEVVSTPDDGETLNRYRFDARLVRRLHNPASRITIETHKDGDEYRIKEIRDAAFAEAGEDPDECKRRALIETYDRRAREAE